MSKIGFTDRWVQLLMTCVRIVLYSIIINGQPHGHIQPTWGIRQGDPLSPYFFILCAEGLSTLLNKVEQEWGITGVPITRGEGKGGREGSNDPPQPPPPKKKVEFFPSLLGAHPQIYRKKNLW
jgi:hypothetical protein